MPVSISQVISVALALAVIYYVLGLIVSTITRYTLEAFNTRGKSLEDFLKRNLIGVAASGKKMTLEKLKSMPQLNSLKPVRYVKKLGIPVGWLTGKTEVIDYIEKIPPKNLVDALFDLEGTNKKGNEKVKEVIESLPDTISPGIDFTIKKELKKLADAGFDDVEALREKLNTWIGGLMDQASETFKAQARWWVVVISFVVTFILGVDSIALAKLYWQNAALSATADAQATLILASTDDENQKNADVQQLITQLDEMKATDQFWYQKPEDAPDDWNFMNIFFSKFWGMVITAIAVSQGSSFWYDLMKQIKGEQPKDESAVSATATSPDGETTHLRIQK